MKLPELLLCSADFRSRIDYPRDIVVVGAFLITSLVVGGIVRRARGLEDQLRFVIDTMTTKPSGMGMELSISRSIIEGHGARLWATPNPTHGATFHVALPGIR